MTTVQFALWFVGLALLSVMVLVAAFTLLLHAGRWNWPIWLRWLSFAFVCLGYLICLLHDQDELNLYRLVIVGGVVATFRFSRGFAKTFLPEFADAFFKAYNKRQK